MFSDRNAAALFNSTIEFEPYSDVLIDISAMPRGIYIPLINKILTVLYKHQKFDLNVHIIISENSALDALISSDGKETEASPIHGLSVSNVSAKDNQKKVLDANFGRETGHIRWSAFLISLILMKSALLCHSRQ